MAGASELRNQINKKKTIWDPLVSDSMQKGVHVKLTLCVGGVAYGLSPDQYMHRL